MTTAALGPLLTVQEVAVELRVSRMSVYRWIHAGDLPAARVGASSIRVSRADLDAFITAARSKAVDA